MLQGLKGTLMQQPQRVLQQLGTHAHLPFEHVLELLALLNPHRSRI
jgi:hypothetical protein